MEISLHAEEQRGDLGIPPRLLLGDSICRLPSRPEGIYSADTCFIPGALLEDIFEFTVLRASAFWEKEVVGILGGTNSLWHMRASTMGDQTKAIIEQLQKQEPQMKIMIMGIIPRLCDDQAIKNQIIKVRKEMKRACRETGAKFIPTHRAFINKQQEIKKELYRPDGLHPSKEGQEEIVRSFSRGASMVTGTRVDKKLGRGVVKEYTKSGEALRVMERVMGRRLFRN